MTLEHDAVREQLVNVTLALLEEGGLDAVKARAVAAAVGVSVGTLYNLFGNVDGLILAANRQIFDELNKRGQDGIAAQEALLSEAIASGEVPDTNHAKALFRLLALSRAYVDFVADNAGKWAAVLAFNRSRRVALTDEAYVAQQDGLIDTIGNVLKGTPLGSEQTRRRVAARALWSSVHGIVTMNYFGVDETRARERTWAQIELLVTTFVDGVFQST